MSEVMHPDAALAPVWSRPCPIDGGIVARTVHMIYPETDEDEPLGLDPDRNATILARRALFWTDECLFCGRQSGRHEEEAQPPPERPSLKFREDDMITVVALRTRRWEDALALEDTVVDGLREAFAALAEEQRDPTAADCVVVAFAREAWSREGFVRLAAEGAVEQEISEVLRSLGFQPEEVRSITGAHAE